MMLDDFFNSLRVFLFLVLPFFAVGYLWWLDVAIDPISPELNTNEMDYKHCRAIIKESHSSITASVFTKDAPNETKLLLRDRLSGNALFKTEEVADRASRLRELGDCYATLGRIPEALASLEKAYELHSTAPLKKDISKLKTLVEKIERERNFNDTYYVTRDLGPALRLTGKTVVAYLFVETNESHWSSLDREQAISTLKFSQKWLISQSKNYQSTLVVGSKKLDKSFIEPTFVNRIFQINKDPTLSLLHKKLNFFGTAQASQLPFARYVVRKLGFTSINSFLNTLKSKEFASNALLIIHLNKRARSFAEPCDHGWCNEEATYILEPVKNCRWQSLHYVLAHEVLHLFGADDLYNIRAAKNYVSADIMHYGSRYLEDSEIRSLTAYAIGWTNVTPSTPFTIRQLGD